MKHTVGGLWVCSALLSLVACSSPEPPPPEGSTRGTVNSNGTHSANISGGVQPSLVDHILGKTVLDGRNGYHVSCSITGGDSYSVSGDITSPDGTSVTVEGSGVTKAQGGTVTMLFVVSGVVSQVSDTNCTLPKVEELEPGSIWASFHCINVRDPTVLGTATGTADGEFVFTGCSR